MSSKDYDKYSSTSGILFYAAITYLINGVIFAITFGYNRWFNKKINLQRDVVDETKQKEPSNAIKKVGVSKTFKSEGAKNIPIEITVPSLASSSVISIYPIIESNRAQQEQNAASQQTQAPGPGPMPINTTAAMTVVTVNKNTDTVAKKFMDLKSTKNLQLVKSKMIKQRPSPSSEPVKDKQPLKAKTVRKRG